MQSVTPARIESNFNIWDFKLTSEDMAVFDTLNVGCQRMDLKPKPDNEFEKQGVTFKIITEDMFEDVKTFMWENFFPDEPISR